MGDAIPILTDISEEEFDRMDPLFRVIAHDSRSTWRFASLKLPAVSHALTMSWHSSTIDPVIEIDPSTSFVWVGVDQQVVCLSSVGNVLFSWDVIGNFLNIIHFPSCTVILSDAELVAVNHDYTIRTNYPLRELVDSVEMKNHQFIITCIDGTQEVF